MSMSVLGGKFVGYVSFDMSRTPIEPPRSSATWEPKHARPPADSRRAGDESPWSVPGTFVPGSPERSHPFSGAAPRRVTDEGRSPL